MKLYLSTIGTAMGVIAVLNIAVGAAPWYYVITAVIWCAALQFALDGLIAALNPRQQQILRLRYGMEDGVCRSFEEIGKVLGISKERARQIERLAMDKLQRLGEGLGLEDYLE